MKITLLVVGKTNDPHFIAGIEEYAKRIRHYLPFDIEVIPELRNTKSLSEEQQKEKEADLLLKAFQPGDLSSCWTNTDGNIVRWSSPHGWKSGWQPD